jgi:anti-sigma B factor antagonist
VTHPRRAETAFSVDARRENGHVVIAPVGELDFASARGLTQAIEQAAVPGGRIVIDLAGVPFMDSCGLRSLFDALRASRSGGWELAVRPGPESVKRLIALAGADRLLPLEHAA